tara:strand:+ start:351 stop:1244 length:894 start_codon:yes stop_codon:yes gene_type:complete
MLGHTYYHQHLRKYVIVFGTLFNDLIIQRKDAANNVVQDIKAPLAYGPREKALARLEQDPNLNRKTAITLPRLTFEMQSFSYAPERKLNKIHRNVAGLSDDKKKLYAAYSPVPYDIGFELNIMTKYAEDATQLLEQILPFFTPEWSITMNLIPEMGWKQDIPVVLNSVSTSDTYEADFETRRALIHTLNFTLKGYFWGPLRKTGIIKTANVMTHVDTSNVYANAHPANTVYANVNVTDSSQPGYYIHSRTTTTPGLLANGSPTSNASATVGIDNIDEDDNYGYIQNFEEWFSANTSA